MFIVLLRLFRYRTGFGCYDVGKIRKIRQARMEGDVLERLERALGL